MSKVLTLIFCFFTTSLLFAGQGKGGGIGFKCREGIYLADTYNKIGQYELDKLKMLSEKVLLKSAFNAHEKDYPERATALKKASQKLTYEESNSVPFAGDDNIQNLPDGCEKIAIGYQDIESGVILYNKFYFDRLSHIDKAYFKFHEAYIQYYNGINDTTIVRSIVSETLINTFINIAGLAHKITGMVSSFNLATDVACREVAYKVLKSTFLISESKEYEICMSKSYKFMLYELGVKNSSNKTNWELEQIVRKEVVNREDELKETNSSYCPKGFIQFGAYSGNGPEVESLFCQYNILGSLVLKYFESNRLEDLSCGAMFSTCDGIKVTEEELKAMVSN